MYEPTGATTPSRHTERASYDAASVHQILDEALVCHVAFVADDRPQVLPMLFVRVGSTLFLHASTGAHMARLLARNGGSRSRWRWASSTRSSSPAPPFSHSANYRAVVAHGSATLVQGAAEKEQILEALMDKVVPGRNGDVRPPTAAELRQTADLGAAAPRGLGQDPDRATVRRGRRPIPRPLGRPVPVREVRGVPEPAPDLAPGVELPSYLQPSTGVHGAS